MVRSDCMFIFEMTFDTFSVIRFIKCILVITLADATPNASPSQLVDHTHIHTFIFLSSACHSFSKRFNQINRMPAMVRQKVVKTSITFIEFQNMMIFCLEKITTVIDTQYRLWIQVIRIHILRMRS